MLTEPSTVAYQQKPSEASSYPCRKLIQRRPAHFRDGLYSFRAGKTDMVAILLDVTNRLQDCSTNILIATEAIKRRTDIADSSNNERWDILPGTIEGWLPDKDSSPTSSLSEKDNDAFGWTPTRHKSSSCSVLVAFEFSWYKLANKAVINLGWRIASSRT